MCALRRWGGDVSMLFCIGFVQSAAIMGGLCCSLVKRWVFIPQTWRCELHAVGIGRKYGNMLADIKAAAMMWRTAEDKGSQNYLSSMFIGTGPRSKLSAGTKFCFRWNWMIHSKIWPENTLAFMQSGRWELQVKLSGRVNRSFISAIQSSLELGVYKG